MAALRTNQDIIKGSALMVFYDGKPIGFATSHSLSMTTNTSQVSTKDHGDYPATLAQNITWEVSCENLYSDDGEKIYMSIMKDMQPVELVFTQAQNYKNDEAQKGLPMEDDGQEWSYIAGAEIAKGTALLTSFNINAPAGDNATMSVTFTGSGDITTNVDNNE